MLNVSAVHLCVCVCHMVVSKVLIRSDLIFWTMYYVSHYTCFIQNPRDLCLSVSPPTSNLENDSQTQLNLNSVSLCGLWLSGKHFSTPRSYHKTSRKADNYEVTSFNRSVAIYCIFWEWPFIKYKTLQNKKPEEHHTFCTREQS